MGGLVGLLQPAIGSHAQTPPNRTHSLQGSSHNGVGTTVGNGVRGAPVGPRVIIGPSSSVAATTTKSKMEYERFIFSVVDMKLVRNFPWLRFNEYFVCGEEKL